MLPTVFAALGATVLLLGMLALWQSLRAAFGAADTSSVRATLGSVERAALIDEKAALLRSLKDLAFEHDVGKIGDADFGEVNASLRSRAREVLRLLDQDVEPYKKEAERLVREHMTRARGDSEPYRSKARDIGTRRCGECDTENDEDADFCKSCRARLTPRTCPKCDTTNDADAAFCKRCAHDFTGDGPGVVAEVAGAARGDAGAAAPAAGADDEDAAAPAAGADDEDDGGGSDDDEDDGAQADADRDDGADDDAARDHDARADDARAADADRAEADRAADADRAAGANDDDRDGSDDEVTS